MVDGRRSSVSGRAGALPSSSSAGEAQPPPHESIATPAAIASASGAVAARALLLRRAGRGVLRALDQLLGLDERAVLVLGHELQPDPAALAVDLLDDHVEHVAAGHHILDVRHPAGA